MSGTDVRSGFQAGVRACTPTLVRRLRPALGTFVELRVEGLAPQRALRAIDRAFAEVLDVQRLMSFHDRASDLSRLHRARVGAAVRIDARTCAVLEHALGIAALSQGRFDPTVAAQQVSWGLLPRPSHAAPPDPQATWRDIEIVGARRVRCARPLWIDLGGIAKGYAVDRAIEILIGAGASQAVVNAGGDLRVHGARTEPIELRHDRAGAATPLLELGDGAVATSASAAGRGPHVHGRTRRPSGGRAVSVVAPRCATADALTKVVLAGDVAITRNTLARCGAHACTFEPGSGWRCIDAAA
jgi:thiamine biosynthesis lipoprotein